MEANVAGTPHPVILSRCMPGPYLDLQVRRPWRLNVDDEQVLQETRAARGWEKTAEAPASLGRGEAVCQPGRVSVWDTCACVSPRVSTKPHRAPKSLTKSHQNPSTPPIPIKLHQTVPDPTTLHQTPLNSPKTHQATPNSISSL